MALPLKTMMIALGGLFLGGTIWLWVQAGPQVFITYAESIAKWCF